MNRSLALDNADKKSSFKIFSHVNSTFTARSWVNSFSGEDGMFTSSLSPQGSTTFLFTSSRFLVSFLSLQLTGRTEPQLSNTTR